MLPPDFHWTPRYVGPVPFGQTLRCDGCEVALVAPRVDGKTFISEVRRYSDGHRPYAVSMTEAKAVLWASRWATANAGAIRQAIQAREARLGLRRLGE